MAEVRNLHRLFNMSLIGKVPTYQRVKCEREDTHTHTHTHLIAVAITQYTAAHLQCFLSHLLLLVLFIKRFLESISDLVLPELALMSNPGEPLADELNGCVVTGFICGNGGGG